jgi:hypothetical protein
MPQHPIISSFLLPASSFIIPAMSTFENKNYRWRETYFVLFEAKKRPKLSSVSKALGALESRYELVNPQADAKGHIETLTVIAADDYAAMDICFLEGEEVLEQAPDLVKDLKKSAEESFPDFPLSKILTYDGRFDVLHFEKLGEEFGEDDGDEMLDPSALLIVLETLAKLTGGVAVDPQSGTLLNYEG